MLLVRYARSPQEEARVGVLDDHGVLHEAPVDRLGRLLALDLSAMREAAAAAVGGPAVSGAYRLLAPVDGLTEVWASGVTYRRSQQARIEESQVSDVYSRVYDADRPELFLKSVSWRVRGDHESVGIRDDSAVDVPEPELALVVSAGGDIVGVTICNDLSSRSIEGENPLYLPQAKIYAGACALGPGIRPIWEVDPTDLAVEVSVTRDEGLAWSAGTRTSEMHRSFEQLVEYLVRADHFPEGVVLSTGTGLVPDLTFSLRAGDVVRIAVEQIGTLTNPVLRGLAAGRAQPPGDAA